MHGLTWPIHSARIVMQGEDKDDPPPVMPRSTSRSLHSTSNIEYTQYEEYSDGETDTDGSFAAGACGYNRPCAHHICR